MREDQQLGFYVEGLKSVPCENYTHIERLLEQGAKVRTTASTNMNASSSRSHMLITIQFKQVRAGYCHGKASQGAECAAGDYGSLQIWSQPLWATDAMCNQRT